MNSIEPRDLSMNHPSHSDTLCRRITEAGC